MLRGHASFFTLELPPYRPPKNLANNIYFFDRQDFDCVMASSCVCGSSRSNNLVDFQCFNRR
jgi:hypothetical protein